jgi:hypothetical protein
MDFSAFTRMFFYLFVCYQYAKYQCPEKTQQFLVCVGYNSIYLYSKLQILFNKKIKEIHEFLMKYEEYQKNIVLLEKILNDFNLSSSTTASEPTHAITLDFISNNEICFNFEKHELINDYLSDFFPDQADDHDHDDDNDDDETDNTDEQDKELNAQPKESILTAGRKALERVLLPDDEDDNDYDDNDDNDDNEEEIESEPFDHEKTSKTSKTSKNNSIINYDFVIINGTDNLKKIIKHDDLIKNDFVSEESSIFKLEPFLYKPLLCEFWNGDDRMIKIDFCDNSKFYDFLVVGNCFDKTFLTYFMKKYYDVDVKYNYILKILDNDVNSILFDRSDVIKLDEKCISK